MKKEVYISLIQKDITELDIIAKGLNETKEIAPVVFRLATKKTQDILTNLLQLAKVQSEQQSKPEETPPPKPKKTEREEQKIAPVEELPIITPPPVVQQEKVTTIADKMAAGAETKMDSIVKSQETNSVASALSNKKVSELKKAISLGDRFRFQRELFSGNVDLMTQTLAHLDEIESYDAALEYLQQQFQWDYDAESVTDFLAILNRRF